MTKKRCILWGILALCITTSLPAASQSGNNYDLTWNTIDNGGTAFSTEGDYQLGGATGQPDAGVLSGGTYTLAGGFWQGEMTVGDTYRIYLPLALRQVP